MKFLLPLFSKGLGGPLGAGLQWMSWIHLDDLVEVVVSALEDERFRGAVNVVAPEPVRNGRFSEELAASLGSSARFAVPSALLRWGLGDASSILLSSSRVNDRFLRGLDYELQYPTLMSALGEITTSASTGEKSAASPMEPLNGEGRAP